MAALSTQDRTRVYRALMRRWSQDRVTCTFMKAQLYDAAANTGAIADCDNWIDTHAANTTPDNVGFNGALAAPMRSALTIDQKTDLFLIVAAMRRGVDYVRNIFGGTE